MASSAPGPTNLGVAPNVGGLLCYLPCCGIGLIFAIVAAIMEKQSRFLRFHAFQSLLLHAAAIVIFGGVWVLSMVLSAISTILGLLLTVVLAVLGLAMLAFIIFMMVKAYNNEEFEIPTLGAMARNWV